MRTRAHSWHPASSCSRQCARVAAAGLVAARPALWQHSNRGAATAWFAAVPACVAPRDTSRQRVQRNRQRFISSCALRCTSVPRKRLECGTCCAPVSTCPHPRHPGRSCSCQCARVAAGGSAAARAPKRQCNRGALPDRPSPAWRATFASPSNARRASTTRYNQMRAAPARLQCGYVKSSRCGTCCAPVSTWGHMYARVRTGAHPLGASAHAWLQLVWLRHAHHCSIVIELLHLPGRRQRCEQRPTRFPIRLGTAPTVCSVSDPAARYACALYSPRISARGAPNPLMFRFALGPCTSTRSHCDVQNRLECSTCCAPVSTCGRESAHVAPCAHPLAPVRTRGCSWRVLQSAQRCRSAVVALHLPGRRRRTERRCPASPHLVTNTWLRPLYTDGGFIYAVRRALEALVVNAQRAAPRPAQLCGRSLAGRPPGPQRTADASGFGRPLGASGTRPGRVPAAPTREGRLEGVKRAVEG